MFAPPIEAAKLKAASELAVGRVDAPLEHEAERVSGHVLRTPGRVVQGLTSGPKTVHRKCDACAEEQQIPLKASGDSNIQRRAIAPEIVHYDMSSSGQPLDSVTRAFFQARFGQDFSDVRIHADGQAALAARSMNAKAYTVGRHIVFGGGDYAPSTVDGRLLRTGNKIVNSSGNFLMPLGFWIDRLIAFYGSGGVQRTRT